MRQTLRALLDGVRRLGFAGVNVTFPYKEAVIPLLDELSPGARTIGAVNTVVVRDGRLIGHNTDTTGFARAIADLVWRLPRRGRADRRRRRRQGDRIRAGESGRHRTRHLRRRPRQAEALSSQLRGRLQGAGRR